MKIRDLFVETAECFDILFDPIEKQMTLEVLDRNIRLTLKDEHSQNTKRFIFKKLETLSIEHALDNCSSFEDLESISI
ncbi:hypothetical protein [Vibrio parahaemolyticus]|uniref:hypothetical protein n=1 Tax=Vibrio parahaemolyticus TaxID=670 RepID=UPI00226B55F6|nr:hypothetical protein [Vibrio parahaemolyticus]MCX8941252.1 hypothetical protein [Vibrio parahaemolyticus]